MSSLDTQPATRDALIRAAERLMAQHGIEGAELREINRLAGQRNRSAVHYHFKDREGLIVAIRDKHRPAIDQHRRAMLDQLATARDLETRDLVQALVQPMAAPLATDSGRDFLIIVAEAAGRAGSRALTPSHHPYTDALNDLTRQLTKHLADSTHHTALVRHAVITTTVLLADIARDLNAKRIKPSDTDKLVNTVTDFITNALTPPAP